MRLCVYNCYIYIYIYTLEKHSCVRDCVRGGLSDSEGFGGFREREERNKLLLIYFFYLLLLFSTLAVFFNTFSHSACVFLCAIFVHFYMPLFLCDIYYFF